MKIQSIRKLSFEKDFLIKSFNYFSKGSIMLIGLKVKVEV